MKHKIGSFSDITGKKDVKIIKKGNPKTLHQVLRFPTFFAHHLQARLF